MAQPSLNPRSYLVLGVLELAAAKSGRTGDWAIPAAALARAEENLRESWAVMTPRERTVCRTYLTEFASVAEDETHRADARDALRWLDDAEGDSSELEGVYGRILALGL
jgi:hypothetical protein